MVSGYGDQPKEVRSLDPRTTPQMWRKLSDSAGLSEYEARVYVSLVRAGSSKAGKLSMLCGVPRNKVYGVLENLKEKGLVIEIPGEPRKFVPTPPSDTFEDYIQSQARTYERRARDLYKVISSLKRAYEEMRSKMGPEKDEVWIVQGRQRILDKVCEMLSRVKGSVNVVTSENGLILLYKAANKLLDKLKESGVKIQIAVQMGDNNRNAVRELRHVCNVRATSLHVPILLVYADHREFLLAKLIPDDLSDSSDEDMGVFSNNPILCGLISELLPHG